nr:uncharacterized protein LOC125625760 isoform X2 [Caretta caretta]
METARSSPTTHKHPPVQTKDWAHTGRETAGPGCALHIAGLTLKDTGSYTVLIQSPTSPVLATVHLPVSDSRCRNETPKENGAPVLVYENLPLTARPGPVTLQPQQQDVYKELKK